jgi:hypothetical protein
MDTYLDRLRKRFLQITARSFLKQISKSFWVVARHISLLMLLVVLYLFIIFSNQQGIDIIGAVISSGSYSFWTFVSVILFDVSLWFCANFILQLKQISFDDRFVKKNEQGIKFLVKNLPTLLGILPILALLLKPEFYNRQSVWFVILLFVFTIILPIVFRANSAFLSSTFRNIQWLNAINLQSQSIRSLLYFRSARIAFWTFTGIISGLFILSLTSIETGFAIYVGPFAILNFGLSFFAVLISLILYINIPGRRPFAIFFAMLYVVFSLFNDNSEIRTITIKNKRDSLETDFTKWERKALRKDSTYTDLKATGTVSTIPVIFIATEGGGIRALSWTGLILDELERIYPGIHKNIYAISGVSGGGVGATFYISYLYDHLKAGRKLSADSAGFRKSVSQDFLSDLLAAYLFQDNLQNFLPVPIPSFNRTRRLEDAWSKSFLKNNNSKTFELPFTELYSDTAIQLPRLFINGVLAESGQKTVVAYPTLTGGKDNIFRDDIDVISTIGQDIPIKTVASLCSRFPYITSGGMIQKFGGENIGHVIDGGYKENTGLETIWQLILRLKSHWQMLQIQKHKNGTVTCIKFQPIVIFIKNSLSVESADIKPSSFLYDLLTPIYGFSRASDRRTPIIDALTKNVFEDYIDKENMLKTCLYYKIDLDRKSKAGNKLPLGWYFSNQSFQFVNSEAQRFLNDTSMLLKPTPMHLELRKYFKR